MTLNAIAVFRSDAPREKEFEPLLANLEALEKRLDQCMRIKNNECAASAADKAISGSANEYSP